MSGKRTTDIDFHVARRIRGRRLELNLSQEHVGGVLGVTFQQMQKYENGSNRISAGQLLKIARILRKPIEWFFDGAPGGARTEVANNSDMIAEFLCKPHAADLARDFIKIKDHASRTALANVASLMARHA